MVRGEQYCSRLCGNCNDDCFCESCGACHTCRDAIHFGGASNGGVVYCDACYFYMHNCKKDKGKKEKRKNEILLEKEAFVRNIMDFPQLFSSDLVKIHLGTASPEVRYVPKNALIESSEYFKSAFGFEEKSGSKQQSDLTLDTDADRPEAFDRFIQFAYWKDYHVSEEEDDIDIVAHAGVYILAERLQALKLKELALRKATDIALQFSKNVKASYGTESQAAISIECIPGVVETIYLNTPSPPEKAVSSSSTSPSDPFRLLIAAFSASCLDKLRDSPNFAECLKVFPDFAVDLMRSVSNGKDLEKDENGFLKYDRFDQPI